MTKLDYSWAKDRKYVHVENGWLQPTKDAPKEVKEAYERFLKHAKEAEKCGTI